MTFAQALRSTLIDKLIDFSGRAPRSEYWWFTAFHVLIVGLVPMAFFLMLNETFMDFEGNNTPQGDMFETGMSALFYIFTVPYVTVSVRRFHDMDLSGWWFLAFFVFTLPIEFDAENETFLYLSLIGSVVPTLMCLRKGTDGPNRFGPDPLKPDHTSVFE